MKYLIYSFSYMKNKNKFWKLALFTSLPAVLIGAIGPLPRLFPFLVNFLTEDYGFLDVFFGVTGLKPVNAALLPVTIGIGALSFSYVAAVIERDMHVGDFNFLYWRRDVNNNFFAYLVLVFFLVVGGELILILAAALISLWLAVFGGAKVIALVLTVVTLIGALVVITIIMSLLLMWPAVMVHTGMKPKSALVHTLRLKKAKGSIAVALVFPFLIFEAVHIGAMTFDNFVVNIGAGIITTMIYFVFFGVHFPVLVNTVYYDVAGLEREDLNRMSIWKRK